MPSERYPRLAPLQINKRAGTNSPNRLMRTRQPSTASTLSNSSLSPGGSLSSTNTYADSASAASIAAEFIAEIDTWLMDIGQQLDELEERHAVHREWLAKGGADDLESAEVGSRSNEEKGASAESTSATSGTFFSFFSRSVARPDADTSPGEGKLKA
ncbi:hypothetical protein BT96DRAFT_325181 [Gymnopus androsaceus JB14]|uniref:Uncharacterized protein n=1 Tax=Gymnopus androsaceus JB14 TaxID=1447944 RepID=A0A6A4I145_9AGAR|nr:hypothetical protein BT96DRAFT_325181 [Gymnopus androsaceus JB14]